MRFETIRFEKVGPFEDTQITLDPKAFVHLIHGPNEAGKSSALKQILAFLFGFEVQSRDDFLHDYKHHRVHATLLSSSNKKLNVFRKRGNKETLSGATEQDLHPLNLDREDYDRLFAIDKSRLDLGSSELFSGNSDLKTVLFESMAGMPSVSEVRKWINANKTELLTVKKGRIGELIAKISAAKDCEKNELTMAEANADKAREYRQTCEMLDTIEGDLTLKRKERKILERLLRGKGLMTDLRQREADLLQVGQVPGLFSGFEQAWEKARADRTKCEGSWKSEEETQTRLAINLQGTPKPKLDPVQWTGIDILGGQKVHVEEAIRDRPGLVSKIKQLEAKIRDWVAVWFPSKANQSLLAWLPEDRLCEQISQLANQLEKVDAAGTTARESYEESQGEFANLSRQIDQLPPLVELDTLKFVLEELNQFGTTQQALDKQGEKLKTDFGDLLVRAKRLAPSVTSEETLDQIACPTAAEIQGFAANWKNQEEAGRTNNKELTTLKNSLLGKQKELDRLQAETGTSLKRSDYEKTKTDRDSTWDLIRGERKGVASNKEVVRRLIESAAVGLDLDETMTGLILKSDQQADTLLSHSENVSKCELLGLEMVQLKRDLSDREADASQHIHVMEGLRADLLRRWESWNAGPTVISDVQGLAEWFQKVGEIRDAVSQNREQRKEYEAKIAEFTLLGNRLSEALGETGPVQTLRRKANTKIDQREIQARERSDLLASRTTQQNSVNKAKKQLERAEEQIRVTKESWDTLVLPLGDPLHEGERTKLGGGLKQIRLDQKESQSLSDRVVQMTTVIDAFLVSLAEATHAAGAGTGPWDLANWLAAMQGLQQLATVDRENTTTLTGITKQLGEAQVRLGQLTLQRNQSRQFLLDLLQQTQCPKEEEVPDLLERIKKKNRLELEIDQKRSQLAQEMKNSVDAYQAELDRFEGPDMEQSLEDLECLATNMDEQAKHLRSKKQSMETIHLELARSEKAAEARQQSEELKVQLEGAVREWKLNHLALLCLGQAIEKNRTSGLETPLSRACHFFKTMTKGRFEEIDFEDDGNKITLKVKRAHADDLMEVSGIEGHGLSEGTADQLWLALRLAGIEARVNQMIQEGRNPMPIILDDVLVSFDEERTKAALEVLAEIGQKTQVILFSHHHHVSELAKMTLGDRADLIALQRA